MSPDEAEEPIAPRWPRGIALLLALGAALRVWQYAADTSFWFDELSIARNLRERSLSDLLLHPLGYDQMAPVGFLGLEKITTFLLGDSDLALRFPLFLAGLFALLLFFRTSARVLDRGAVPIAVALFAIAIPFIRYSTELKQYGLDVAATLLLTNLALDLRAGPTPRRCVAAGLAGLVAVVFSQTAVLVLAGLGGALALCLLLDRDRRALAPVLIAVLLWAAAAGTGLLIALHHSRPETRAFMHTFWASRKGFLPLPPSFGGTALWLWSLFEQFFGDISQLQYPLSFLFTALALLGFVVLYRQRRDRALILLGPVAATLLAALAQQFPFRFRLVLFLLPTVLLGLAAAIGWLGVQSARLRRPLGAAVVAALMLGPLFAIARTRPPYVVEAFKPVLAHVRDHYQRGDAVYVYANAFQAVDRYGPLYGLPPGSWAAGACDEREVRPFLADVDRFRGKARLWVIASSVPEFRHPRNEIARYLRTIGVARDSIAVPSPVSKLAPVGADLYDLSDPERLRAATVSSFAAAPFPDPQRPLCRDWIRPTASGRTAEFSDR